MAGLLQGLQEVASGSTAILPGIVRAHRFRAGTDEELPYGMGGAYLGGHGGRSATDDVAVYHEAFAAGVRYFDTSSSRQYGRSEEHLGLFLREIPRQDVFVATKLMPGSEGGGLADQLERGLHAALRRLQTDHLDLYQLHDIGNFEQCVPPHTVDHLRERIEHWTSRGLIRFFGIGVKSQPVLRAAMRSGLVESILTHNELLPIWPSAVNLIGEARQQGIAVINGSPLGFGLLTGTDPSAHRPHPSRMRVHALAVRFFAHCREWDVPVVAAALQFPTAFPEVDINLTGPGNSEELRSSLRLLRHPIPRAFWASWFEKVSQDPAGPGIGKWQAAERAVVGGA